MREGLSQWDGAVRAWRLMRSQRPLGAYYVAPVVPLAPELTVLPRRYSLPAGWSTAFWTMDTVARGGAS